jgi:hypothetical protein
MDSFAFEAGIARAIMKHASRRDWAMVETLYRALGRIFEKQEAAA